MLSRPGVNKSTALSLRLETCDGSSGALKRICAKIAAAQAEFMFSEVHNDGGDAPMPQAGRVT
eukprot:2115737-Amphidinium_carterae.1